MNIAKCKIEGQRPSLCGFGAEYKNMHFFLFPCGFGAGGALSALHFAFNYSKSTRY